MSAPDTIAQYAHALQAAGGEWDPELAYRAAREVAPELPEQPRPHPAKYSPDVLDAIRDTLATMEVREGGNVVDVYAGVGLVHRLRPYWRTMGVELELEWAAQGFPFTACGDSRDAQAVLERAGLLEPGELWDAAATSCSYGNRMADPYQGERCKAPDCRGGEVSYPEWEGRTEPCPECEGTGRKRTSRRHTYPLDLGRPLTDGSGAGMQWGPEYRELHREVWEHTVDRLAPGGVLVLNVSDHVRDHQLQGVDLWHASVLGALGLELERATPVYTRRMRDGANASARAQCEWVLGWRKPKRQRRSPRR